MKDLPIRKLAHLRSVAIIGGADTVDPKAYDRDLVVRVNDHFPRQGGRCDVLFLRPNVSNLIPTLHAASELHPSAIVLALVHGKHLKELPPSYTTQTPPCPIHIMQHGGNQPIVDGDIEHLWVDIFFREWDFTPLTGVLAIEYFRRMCPASIFVTGMDLYSISNVTTKGAHDLRKQAAYLAHIERFDRRVCFDTHFSNCIQRLNTAA